MMGAAHGAGAPLCLIKRNIFMGHRPAGGRGHAAHWAPAPEGGMATHKGTRPPFGGAPAPGSRPNILILIAVHPRRGHERAGSPAP